MTRPQEQPSENPLEKFRGYCQTIFSQVVSVEADEDRSDFGTLADEGSKRGATREFLNLMKLGVNDLASAKTFLVKTAKELMESGQATPLEIAKAIAGTPVAGDSDVLLSILASVPFGERRKRKGRRTEGLEALNGAVRDFQQSLLDAASSTGIREARGKMPKLPGEGEDVIE